MKKILILLLLLSSGIVFSQQKKRKKTGQAKAQQALTNTPSVEATTDKPYTLPGAGILNFSILTHKEQLFMSDQIPKQKPFVLMLFNPQCDHCGVAAKGIKEQMADLQDCTFVLMTGNNLLEYIPKFVSQYGIDNIPNMHIGIDNSGADKQLFEYKGIPQVMIYNQEHKLQKTFYVNIPVDSIKYFIRN